MNPIPTLSGHRINKLRERVEMLEKALIDTRAQLDKAKSPFATDWFELDNKQQAHYRTLAENELIREGFVRAKEVREMER